MPAITLNPGFLIVFAALAMLALPRAWRPAAMALSAIAALWLLLDYRFGSAAAVAQMGLSIVPLELDPLNRVFGIGFLIALVLIAIYSGARRNRVEDFAVTLLAGGAVTALFVGDLVSFLAALSLAGLATAWVVLASPSARANQAGVRVLVWHGLEGLLFLIGVAFHISADAESSIFGRMDLSTISGGFVFAALMIRVGAPFAHVWSKDAIAHASHVGAVALTVFPAMLGVYAVARLFPAEAALIPIGLAMMALGLLYALAEDDLRAGAAYGYLAHVGVCLALIGIGSPMARAGGEAHAFTTMFAFLLIQMALGALAERQGEARASTLAGAGRVQPLSVMLALVGGLAAAGAPGLATYASVAVALQASANWDYRLVWLGVSVVCAGLAPALALRPILAAHRPGLAKAPGAHAPFPMLLAMSVAAFFSLAIGLSPSWLFRLTPAELNFAPYSLEAVAPHLSLLGAACATYLVLHMLGLERAQERLRILDVDAFYRGPVAAAGRWLGVVALRVLGAGQTALAAAGAQGARGFQRMTEALDRPYRDGWAGAALLLTLACLLFVAAIVVKAGGEFSR